MSAYDYVAFRLACARQHGHHVINLTVFVNPSRGFDPMLVERYLKPRAGLAKLAGNPAASRAYSMRAVVLRRIDVSRPEALELLRSLRRDPERNPAIAVANTDPLNLAGIILPGPRVSRLAIAGLVPA